MAIVAAANDFVTILIDASVKATVLLTASWLTLRVLSRSSAAIRHRIGSLTMIGLIVLPALSWCLPAWHWAVLPELPSPMLLPAKVIPVDDARSLMINAVIKDVVATQAVSLPERSTTTAEFEVSTPVAEPRARSNVLPVVSQVAWSSTLILMIWSGGAAVCLGALAVGLWQVEQLSRRSRVIEDDAWRTLLDDLRGRLRLKKTVELRECPQSLVPLTWGLLRSRVMLPAAARSWGDRMRRVVLLHELAHVQRADVAYQLLGRIACAVYWFHPLAWLALRRLREEREQACDDAVLQTGERASDYAEQLVQIARLYSRPSGLALAVEMARGGTLESRLQALFDAAISHHPVTWKWGVVALLGASSLVCAVAVIRPVAMESIETVKTPAERETSTLGRNESTPPQDDSDRSTWSLEELVQTGTFTIKGLVVFAATDAPAAGVSVYATGGGDEKHAYETTTDSDGHYLLEVENDSYELHASAQGLVCVPLIGLRAKVGETLEVAHLKLGKGDYVSGKVTDAETGLPVTTTRNGEPLFVAYACWGNRYFYKEFGAAPVQHDGTYLLEVPPGRRPLLYLRDPEVEYTCDVPEFQYPISKSANACLANFEILGPRNEDRLLPPRSQYDDIDVENHGVPIDVGTVLDQLRKFYSSVATGEFMGREESVTVTREGRRETFAANIRGVFNRCRDLVRHEYEPITPRFQSLYLDDVSRFSDESLANQRKRVLADRQELIDRIQKERNETVQVHDHIFQVPGDLLLVVLSKDFATISRKGTITSDSDFMYQMIPGAIPLDPIAAGVFPYLRELVFEGNLRRNKLHNFERFQDFLFKDDRPELKLKIELLAFQVGELVVLQKNIHNAKQAHDSSRRIILDPRMGYAPVRTVETYAHFGKPSSTRRMLTVTWRQHGEVWIPTLLDDCLAQSWDRERRTVKLDWQSVNEPIPDKEFGIPPHFPNTPYSMR